MAKKVLHIISPVTDLIFNQLICEANPDGKNKTIPDANQSL